MSLDFSVEFLQELYVWKSSVYRTKGVNIGRDEERSTDRTLQHSCIKEFSDMWKNQQKKLKREASEATHPEFITEARAIWRVWPLFPS